MFFASKCKISLLKENPAKKGEFTNNLVFMLYFLKISTFYSKKRLVWNGLTLQV